MVDLSLLKTDSQRACFVKGITLLSCFFHLLYDDFYGQRSCSSV